MNKTKVLDWGLIGYQESVKKQETLRKSLIEQKKQVRDGQKFEKTLPHYLVLCQHPHVYTLGKSGDPKNLVYNDKEMDTNKIEFHKTSRGGDITYHGPGQLVVYPILDLDELFNDVHRYVRQLEEVVIRLLNKYKVNGLRKKDYTGVWVEDESSNGHKKICAIGVHLSRWVSMHGLALNVNPDLQYFSGIIPCGINEEDMGITSLSQLLGLNIFISDIKDDFIQIFLEVFGLEKI